MNKVKRFLKAARNVSKNPLVYETKEYLELFGRFSETLFNTKIIEIYSSNVFPETLKFKDGSKVLVWDSTYWYIFNNIIALYFFSINAKEEQHCEGIKQRLEAEIYYFLALKMEFNTPLSTEITRSYYETIKGKFNMELTPEELVFYNKSIKEINLIAKVFCLFHELNHMDQIEESTVFDKKVSAMISMLSDTYDILRKDTFLVDNIRNYYSPETIKKAIKNMIDRQNPELEIELTCDLAAINDTVDFFEKIWGNMSKEKIFSKVNEVVLVVNSINMTLIQTYSYWKMCYEYYSHQIDRETFSVEINKMNDDAMLRFILSDIVKAIQTNDVYGKKIEEILNTDYYGLRYQTENSFIEDTMKYINNEEFFGQVYANSCNYEEVDESKLEYLKNAILKW